MKNQKVKRSLPLPPPHGRFISLRFVPGDLVNIKFVASSFIQIVLMDFEDEIFEWEKPDGKEDELPF